MRFMKTPLFMAGLLSVSQAFAGPACDVVTAQDLSIYYNNGMFSDRIEAKLAVMTLQDQLQQENLDSNVEPKVSIAYSQPTQALNSVVTSAINQQESDWAKVLGWLFNDADDGLAPEAWFTNAIHQLTTTTAANTYANTADIDFQTLQYRADILTGSRVIVVAHGEGNFYATAANERLEERFSEELINGEPVPFNGFGIAPIASVVNGNIGHLFLDSYLLSNVGSSEVIQVIHETIDAVDESQTLLREGVLIDITMSWPLGQARDVDLHIREPLAGPVGTDLQRYIQVKHNVFQGNYGQLDVDAKDNTSIEHYTVECIDLEDQFTEDGRTSGTFEIMLNYVEYAEIEQPVSVDVLISAGDLVRSFENIILTEVRDPSAPEWNADTFTIPVVNLDVELTDNQFEFSVVPRLSE